VVGTTTLDYWAVVPSTQHVLHATRTVVVTSPFAPPAANDNPPPAANDNPAVTSTAQ
jgi:hypothetical protein